MNLDTAPPKHNPGVCRCCLSEGCYKDLSTEYTWVNETEIYADMLLECFDVSISQHAEGPNGLNRYICEVCITRLRDACHFKQQVICSEKKFIDMVSQGEFSSEKTAYSEFSLKQEDQTDGERSPAVEYLDEGADFSEEDDKPLKDMSSVKEAVTALVSAGNESCRRPKRKQKSETKDKTLSKRNKLIKEEVAETSTTLHKGVETSEELKRREMAHRLMLKRKNIEYVLLYSNVTPFFWYKGRYRCFYCAAAAKNWQHLKDHTSSKHRQENLELVIYDRTNLNKNKDVAVNIDVTDIECKVCFRPIDSFEGLLRHIIDEHDAEYDVNLTNCFMPFIIRKNVWLECGICRAQFMHFESLLHHSNKCHVSRDYVCDECGASFQGENFMMLHKKRFHSKDGYSCEDCDLVLPTLTEKIFHKRNAHPARPRSCDFCPETFKNLYFKKQHLLEAHQVEALKMKCQYCPKVYPQPTRMSQHIRRVHFKEKNVECGVCGHRFFDAYNLKLHMVRHDGVKRFMCSECGLRFTKKSNLSSHIATHSKRDARFCCICNVLFSDKAELSLHTQAEHCEEFDQSDDSNKNVDSMDNIASVVKDTPKIVVQNVYNIPKIVTKKIIDLEGVRQIVVTEGIMAGTKDKIS